MNTTDTINHTANATSKAFVRTIPGVTNVTFDLATDGGFLNDHDRVKVAALTPGDRTYVASVGWIRRMS